MCTADVMWPEKLVYIVDLNENWCKQCATHGFTVGDQDYCSPAEICTHCGGNYSSKSIVKRVLHTGERVCLACTKEGKSVV